LIIDGQKYDRDLVVDDQIVRI